ncbi:MAG: AGE family epimerase/isomerase [Verrucomicrobiota bacterium]
MNQKILEDFSRSVHNQLYEHILPFWTGPALDHEQGGWLGWMDNDSRIDRAKPKGLIVNSRILWTFSAVFRASPKKIYGEMAGRAYEIMTKRFWDSRHGGAFWRLTDDWRVLDDAKKIYGQAFCIYALVEYHQAFDDEGALTLAIQLFELVERHAHDSGHGGYFEVCHRDWSSAENSRLSEKDMAEKKSMNNHLHVLEAYTNLYRAWKNPRVDTYTFGHDIEATWLLCEATDVLEDAALLAQTRAIALKMTEAVLNEGHDTDSGLFYEGRAGQIIDRGKEWWPQAEAVVGFLNALEISREEKFFNAARQTWNYIMEHMVDRVHGDWFWRINEDGKPDSSQPKISEWKGPYHSSRACLETLRLLNQIHPPKK